MENNQIIWIGQKWTALYPTLFMTVIPLNYKLINKTLTIELLLR